ncbi:MAG TPA: PilZ domain-containing protein, partial [Terriglobia bacterium]|nr:PilZ domain-containing protein [Terriglobia bacterium]
GSIWMESDQRRHPRADWGGDAILYCSGQEFILTAHNVSEGGMLAEAERELPVSAQGFISFQLKPGKLPLACKCRVVYSIDGRGAGIEFLDVSDETRWTLKNFVNEAN